MADRESETLRGGNVNVVHREGHTVVRTAGPWTPSVHEVLRHVRSRGFPWAPEPLAIAGPTERLSFIAGDTVGDSEPWPPWVWTDELLRDAAAAAKLFHDAVRDIQFAGPTTWRLASISHFATEGDEAVLCHNDLAPYNVVVGRDGRLAGIFDWDLLAPGTRRWELAFMAWQWAPLHHPVLAERLGWDRPDDVGRRVRLLCDSYGLTDRTGFVDAVIERITASRDGIRAQAAAGEPAFVRMVAEGHADDMAATIAYVERIRSSVEAAL